MSVNSSKQCGRCGTFNRNKRNRCLKCNALRQIKYRENNLEKCKQIARTSELKRYNKIKETNPEYLIWRRAKERARVKGVPFTIKVSDVVIPKTCPVLGMELHMSSPWFNDASPSLDRIIPDKGYVLGNIEVISLRANNLKKDASLEELESLLSWLRKSVKTE